MHIDFEMFRLISTDALRKAERKSPAGRKPLDVLLMFKALIIQRLFNLSDKWLEFQITDPQGSWRTRLEAACRSYENLKGSAEAGAHRRSQQLSY